MDHHRATASDENWYQPTSLALHWKRFKDQNTQFQTWPSVTRHLIYVFEATLTDDALTESPNAFISFFSIQIRHGWGSTLCDTLLQRHTYLRYVNKGYLSFPALRPDTGFVSLAIYCHPSLRLSLSHTCSLALFEVSRCVIPYRRVASVGESDTAAELLIDILHHVHTTALRDTHKWTCPSGRCLKMCSNC